MTRPFPVYVSANAPKKDLSWVTSLASPTLSSTRSIEAPFHIHEGRVSDEQGGSSSAKQLSRGGSRLSAARDAYTLAARAVSAEKIARRFASSKAPSRGKRIPLLSPPVGGKAGLDYQIVAPSIKCLIQDLEARLGRKTIDRLARANKFRSCLLNLRVEMADPSKWALEWARFNFQLATRWASALSFAPSTQGISVLVKKTGSRTFLLSASGTIGASPGSGVGGALSYDSARGWQVEYSTTVDEVKGSSQKNARKEQEIVWDLYRDKAIGVPDASLGSTVTVPVVALIQFPKDKEEPVVTVTAEGKTRRIAKGVLRRRAGVIETTSVGGFSLKPTL